MTTNTKAIKELARFHQNMMLDKYWGSTSVRVISRKAVTFRNNLYTVITILSHTCLVLRNNLEI